MRTLAAGIAETWRQAQWLRMVGSLMWRWRRGLRVAAAALAALGLLSVAIFGGETPLWAQDENSGIGIAFDDLSDYPTYTTVDRFLVALTNLTATEDYQVIVSSDSAALGIGGCSTTSQKATVTGVEEHKLPFLVYACAVGEGTVTAEVRLAGATDSEASISRHLTVPELPDELIRADGTRVRAPAPGTATKTGTPGIVPNIRFDNKTATSVRVRWGQPFDGGTPLTGFGLKFWKDGDMEPPYENPVVIGPPPTPSEYTKTGMERGATYNFRIHACNGDDSCGYWTNPPKQVGLPKKPHTISVDDKKATSARVRWAPDADTGNVALTGFGIRWREQGASWPTHAQATPGPSARSHTMTGLTAGTTYEVSLQSCNGTDSCSPWTSALEFGTDDPAPTPEPPGLVGNLRPAGTGKNTVSIAWDVPSTSGTVTGYHVQHRNSDTPDLPLRDDEGWPVNFEVAPPETDPDWTIEGLINGTPTDVRVRACNSADCGAWTLLTDLVPGNKVGSAWIDPATATIDIGERLHVTVYDIPVGEVAYMNMYGAIQPEGRCPPRARGAVPRRFGDPSTGGWYDSFRIDGCADGGLGWIRVTNQDESKLFAYLTITVRPSTTTTPPQPPNPPIDAVIRPTIGQIHLVNIAACETIPNVSAPPNFEDLAPEHLDVVPFPERRAKLTWQNVPGARRYEVQARYIQANKPTNNVFYGPWRTLRKATDDNTDLCHLINLDQIIKESAYVRGLAEYPGFAFKIRAINANGDTSMYSREIAIIDTPVIEAIGHSPGSPTDPGQAMLRWLPIDRILPGFGPARHEIRPRIIRSVLKDNSPFWLPHIADSHEPITTVSHFVGEDGNLFVPIDRLQRNAIYAFQLVFDAANAKVFASRDSFVWTSNSPVIGRASVALESVSDINDEESPYGVMWLGGFPVRIPLEGNVFEYHVCDDTFPEPTRERWLPLIQHAFDQWRVASSDLISLRYMGTVCPDFGPIVEEILPVLPELPGLSVREKTTRIQNAIDRVRFTTDIFDSSQAADGSGDSLRIERKASDIINADRARNEVIMYDDGVPILSELATVALLPEFASSVGYFWCWSDDDALGCAITSKSMDQVNVPGYTTDIYLRLAQFEHDSLVHPAHWMDTLAVRGQIAFNRCPSSSSTAYGVLIHEVGHALGIRSVYPGVSGHPSTSIDSVMARAYTVNSCFPHPLDIMLIEALYRAR